MKRVLAQQGNDVDMNSCIFVNLYVCYCMLYNINMIYIYI